MRRVLAVPFLLLLLLSTPMATPRAWSQEPAIDLRLVSQSAWNGPKRPLELTVRATNGGDRALDDLSVALTILAPARSRSVYELSLRTDATSVLLATSFPEPGTLDPGATRTFRLPPQQLDLLSSRDEDALYPLKVELRSRDVAVAAIRTPMVFLVERPKVPLNLAWAWVLHAPIAYGPDGVFLNDSVERAVARGGRLDGVVRALLRAGGGGVDLIVSPVLVDELQRMARGGYRVRRGDGSIETVERGTAGSADAARVLASLRTIAARPLTELLATPFGDPSIPALLRSGLAADLPALQLKGRERVAEALGRSVTRSVARPPLGDVDATTLTELSDLGARTVLLDPGAVPQEAGLQFSPSPIVQPGGAPPSVTAVVPDEGVIEAARAFPDDPLLAARAALGELAAIWFEFPGTPGRGAALLFPEVPGFAPAFLRGLATLVPRSPWLRPLRAGDFVQVIGEERRASLPLVSHRGFRGSYVTRFFQVRDSLARFEASVRGANPTVAGLRDDLLLAEGGTMLSRPDLGLAFVEHVNGVIHRVYGRVELPPSVVTLTSRRGTILITIRNETGYRLTVDVRLIAGRRLVFAKGSSRTVTLPTEPRTLSFPVLAQTTGRFPITIQLQTVGGDPVPEIIAETQVVIRSTAYNRVALFLTIGAALFLLAWWGRRFVPRRKA